MKKELTFKVVRLFPHSPAIQVIVEIGTSIGRLVVQPWTNHGRKVTQIRALVPRNGRGTACRGGGRGAGCCQFCSSCSLLSLREATRWTEEQKKQRDSGSNTTLHHSSPLGDIPTTKGRKKHSSATWRTLCSWRNTHAHMYIYTHAFIHTSLTSAGISHTDDFVTRLNQYFFPSGVACSVQSAAF